MNIGKLFCALALVALPLTGCGGDEDSGKAPFAQCQSSSECQSNFICPTDGTLEDHCALECGDELECEDTLGEGYTCYRGECVKVCGNWTDSCSKDGDGTCPDGMYCTALGSPSEGGLCYSICQVL
jgi:hypothetical protein